MTIIHENEIKKIKKFIMEIEDLEIIMGESAKNIMSKFVKDILRADKDNREFYSYEDVYMSIRRCNDSYFISFGDDAECCIDGGDINKETFYKMLNYLMEVTGQ